MSYSQTGIEPVDEEFPQIPWRQTLCEAPPLVLESVAPSEEQNSRLGFQQPSTFFQADPTPTPEPPWLNDIAGTDTQFEAPRMPFAFASATASFEEYFNLWDRMSPNQVGEYFDHWESSMM